MTAGVAGRAARPRSGPRPSNRREEILAAASQLFVERGYDDVGMSDIAASVALTPSALYRYFAGKEDLLVEAISTGVRQRIAAIEETEGEGPERVLLALAKVALARSQSHLLWHLHGRSLNTERARDVRAQARRVPATLAQWLRRQRPQVDEEDAVLLAWAALATLMGPAFHDERIPLAQYHRLLAEAAQRVLWAPVPEPPPDAGPVVAAAAPTVRRERLLAAAAELFSHRGVHGVTLDDLGAAVGIAGASVYLYVTTKQQLIDLVVMRGVSWLEFEDRHHLDEQSPATDQLTGHLTALARFCALEPALMRTLMTQRHHAADWVVAQVGVYEREMVATWAQLLRDERPDLDAAHARVLVAAARTLVIDLLTTRRMRQRPGIEQAVVPLALRVLGIGPG